MPTKNTNTAIEIDDLFLDLEVQKEPSNNDNKSQTPISQNDALLSSLENTQMVEKSHLSIVKSADSLDENSKSEPVLLGNTKTVLTDEASKSKNTNEDHIQEALQEHSSDKGQVHHTDQVNHVKEEEVQTNVKTEALDIESSNQNEIIESAEDGYIDDITIFRKNKDEDVSSESSFNSTNSAEDSDLSLVQSLNKQEENKKTPIEGTSHTSSSSLTATDIIHHVDHVDHVEEQMPLMHPASSAQQVLKRADQLKMAQDRIKELESMLFSTRQENESLSLEVESLTKRVEELAAQLDSSERRSRTKIEGLSDERNLIEESLFQKDKELNNMKLKVEQLTKRLAKDLKSVRIREIELENRLELVKQEKTALLKNKDEIILNLKRKADHLTMDIDGYRKKNQSTQAQISENEERVQRSVRALRLALSMLEGSDSSK